MTVLWLGGHIMNLKLTEKEWLKLRDFNKKIAINILARLPEDWKLPLEDIEGAIYDTFINLLNNYKDGAMSPTSYCWKFAEQYTYRNLMREYKRLKNQDTLDQLYGEDYNDNEICRRKYGVGEVPSLTVDERKKQELVDDVNEILKRVSPQDRCIMKLIMEGRSLREIGELFGMSQVAIQKRLKKYSSIKS